MNFSPAIAFLVLLAVAGYALFCLLAGGAKKSPCEILGISGLLGSAAVPMFLFWFSLAGFKPTRAILFLIFFICLSLLGILAWRRRLVTPVWSLARLTWADGLTALSVVLIVWSVVVVKTSALGSPLTEWDGWATWGFKAKFLYTDSIPNLDGYFKDLTLSFSHLDYPMLVSFLYAGCYAAIGTVDDQIGKVTMVFLFLSYVFFLYGAMRPFLPRAAAAALTALAVSAFRVLFWSGRGTADMPLTMFYAASIYFVARWIGGSAASDIRLASAFAAACVFTKNEGMPMAAINVAAVLLFVWLGEAPVRRLKEFGGATLGMAAYLLPWFIFRHGLPHVDENYFAHLNVTTLLANRDRIPLAGDALYSMLFHAPYYNYIWVLAFGAYLAGALTRLRIEAPAMLFLLLAHLFVYLLAYIISPWPDVGFKDLLGMTEDRLVMHVMPAAVFLAAFSLSKILPGEPAALGADAADQPPIGTSNQNLDPTPG